MFIIMKNFKFIKTGLLIFLSAIIYVLTLKAFIEPANLYPAGFVGIAKLISVGILKPLGFDIPFMMLYFILQLIMTLFVFRLIGKRFCILTIFQFSLVSILSLFVPDIDIVDDRILMIIFGGVLSGISAILAIKAEGSTGGTDFIAIYLQNKDPKIPAWDIVMYINYSILFFSGLLEGWTAALYSMVYQFITTMTINSRDSRNRLSCLHIISEKGDEISKALLARVSRGMTKIDGCGIYTGVHKDVLLMVVNYYEVNEVIAIIQSIDKNAFVNVTKTERVVGNFQYKKLQ